MHFKLYDLQWKPTVGYCNPIYIYPFCREFIPKTFSFYFVSSFLFVTTHNQTVKGYQIPVKQLKCCAKRSFCYKTKVAPLTSESFHLGPACQHWMWYLVLSSDVMSYIIFMTKPHAATPFKPLKVLQGKSQIPLKYSRFGIKFGSKMSENDFCNFWIISCKKKCNIWLQK